MKTNKKTFIDAGLKLLLHLSRSNKKLQSNIVTAFIIFNLPRIITCPYATTMCKKKCYIAYAERFFPHVIPARRDNLELSKTSAFVPILTDRIRSIADHCRKDRLIVRIHEGGDFYSLAYTEKWLRIIDNCSDDKRILFVAYTKSFPFFVGVTIPSNFALRASLWDDTAPEQLAIVAKNGWPTYSAVNAFGTNDPFAHCRCKDCATCNMCWNKDIQDIRCLIHSGRQGAKAKKANKA